MQQIRAFLFTLWLYGSMPVVAIGLSPALLMSERAGLGVIHVWTRVVLFGLRHIVGCRVEFRGIENRPREGGLVAAKHQSFLDIVALFNAMPDGCFVLKKELMAVPFIGWFAWKTRMIPVDRSAGSAALKAMVRRATPRIAEGRQVLIFPEGTRQAPGAPPDYKPGVAALYRELQAPCWPVATNAGKFWPARGTHFQAGTAVFEFLPVIPPGLKRGAFMTELEARIEAASDALL